MAHRPVSPGLSARPFGPPSDGSTLHVEDEGNGGDDHREQGKEEHTILELEIVLWVIRDKSQIIFTRSRHLREVG